ncbi:MAG: hypothetical protein N4A46_14195 [Schleiferiaceae bacterium]|jgi:uncharacterized membrane protein|nr:hypothetical protein [Schleiferiaceae bacterium]
MIDVFLKAKHWQLFIPLIIIPILGIVYLIFQMLEFAEMPYPAQPDANDVNSFLSTLMIFVLLPVITLAGWMWSVGVGLNDQLHWKLQKNTTLFKICVVLPAIAALISAFGFVNAIYDPYESPQLLSFLVVLNLISSLAMFYSFYFMGRIIKTAEHQADVAFRDYLAEIFMIWFYFIGIWFLQPKVNRIIQKDYSAEPDVMDHLN